VVLSAALLEENAMKRIIVALGICLVILLVAGPASLRAGQGEDRKPKPVRKVQPPYPYKARAKRIAGLVLVDVLIREDGKVEDAQIASGPKELQEAAQKAAVMWQFNTEETGTGTRSARLSFQFCITDKDGCAGKFGLDLPYSVFIELDPNDHLK
jgi:TonB family protein